MKQVAFCRTHNCKTNVLSTAVFVITENSLMLRYNTIRTRVILQSTLMFKSLDLKAL